jgi:predicted  nucleic acid-binding Zn-ribbon protein
MTDDEITHPLSELQAENSELLKTTVESLRHEIRQVAESLADVKATLQRKGAEIREEMRRGFAETQAMLKFPKRD